MPKKNIFTQTRFEPKLVLKKIINWENSATKQSKIHLTTGMHLQDTLVIGRRVHSSLLLNLLLRRQRSLYLL